MFQDLKIVWGDLEEISLGMIEHGPTRNIIRRLRLSGESIFVEVVLCSDGRNEQVRVALDDLHFVRAFNVAGNNAYGSKRKRAIVIIAHGPVCGAVDYARKGDPERRYPSFLTLCADPRLNAGRQLEKYPPEDWAGVLYYDHDNNILEDVPEYDGPHVKWKQVILQEVNATLRGSLTPAELEMNRKGQDPVAIVVTDIATPSSGRSAFTVNLQNGMMTEPVLDSIQYAIDHALTGSKSFTRTATMVIAFRGNDALPEGFRGFMKDQERFIGFMKRGGRIYLYELGDLPSRKHLYELKSY
jgi:hypothetical protein